MAGQPQNMDADVLTEVPETLKRLIRYIARGFYSIEHALIIDLLVHHPCIKEDDILALLKFERKQLRALLVSLKNDKFVKTRMRVETDASGTSTRHNYYFINYSAFVNVVKYKLDVMRKRIEVEERDSTSRASFKCPSCDKTFTDLEVDQLFDPMQGQLLCTYCRSEVEEEATAQPKTNARTLMVKFNEQITPVFALLGEVEDIKLAHSILEPEPSDLKGMTEKHGGSSTKYPSGSKWSGDNTKGITFGDQENRITIDLSDSNETAKTDKLPVKDTPIWISSSTVEGASSDSYNQPDAALSSAASASEKRAGAANNDDIMRILLANEKKGGASVLPAAAALPTSDNESSTSESDDEFRPKAPQVSARGVEEMESDEEEDTVPMVTIGTMRVPYNEVTEEMVDRMTASEKDAYIHMGQEMYENMYD